jgi:hypothetical protein
VGLVLAFILSRERRNLLIAAQRVVGQFGETFPQGLKPAILFGATCGTIEVVPLQIQSRFKLSHYPISARIARELRLRYTVEGPKK